MPDRSGRLKAREFLFLCEDLALAALPASLPRPERRVMWTILQFYYGDTRVHFELQPQVARGVVELGLHFEGPVELNDRWAALVAAHAPEIVAALGDGWELEEWTPSWRRLHRTWAFTVLTADLARDVGGQLAAAIVALHPVIEEGLRVMPPAPDEPRQRTPGDVRREHWRRARSRG